jgi:hypothetical protein
MRYYSHRGNLSGWIWAGAGLALGFLLLKFFLGLLILGVVVWSLFLEINKGEKYE